MNQRRAILALNPGSATLKARFYRDRVVAGAPLQPSGECLHFDLDAGLPATGEASQAARLFELLLAALPANGPAPEIVAYRIVHGGTRVAPVLLDDEVLGELACLEPLAPLHQPVALQLVRAARARWPAARHVAVFDTSWHAGLAEWSRRLPIPLALHEAGVVRFGFHGIAFQSAFGLLSALDDGARQQRIVLAHLGSGSSLCAVQGGRSIDTTMGFTPLDGLPMATRSGSLDPGVLLYLQRELRMTPESLQRALWRESGQLGVSGLSGDMRVLLESALPAARLAVDQFVMRVAQGVAAMATSLGGIDAVVFSGGIGSHSPPVRERVLAQLAWMGIRMDTVANASGASRIDAADSASRVWQVLVDEELELATSALACAQARA
ncbi:MAG: acetate kinase [Arenimonas sp.]